MKVYVLLLAIALILAAAPTDATRRFRRRFRRRFGRRVRPSRPQRRTFPFPNCRGRATYDLRFTNFLTGRNFKGLIPSTGLVYSPAVAVSHSNRVSLMTVRGFASPPVEDLCETGNNTALATLARSLVARRYVRTVATADGPTRPGNSTTLRVTVDCKRPFTTMMSMIAPSPDWIVQVSNRNMFNTTSGRFVRKTEGDLIAYDCGVDSGREFTPPMDTSLDIPTVPAKNIAPLREDDTDRFDARVVGRYVFSRVY